RCHYIAIHKETGLVTPENIYNIIIVHAWYKCGDAVTCGLLETVPAARFIKQMKQKPVTLVQIMFQMNGLHLFLQGQENNMWLYVIKTHFADITSTCKKN
ncbi:hypothetical protein ACJX0J_021052, partial [Zea mays]